MAIDTSIIVAKGIRVDKDYLHVINYSEANMVALLQTSGHYVASSDTYSFIRDTGTIKVAFDFDDVSICNYMAFKNTSYYNKWFFAWIDKVEYRGDNCVEIFYTVDMWSTWWNQMTFNPVLVEREHVNTDTFGAYTEPEPISGNMYINNAVSQELFADWSVLVFYVSKTLSASSLSFVTYKSKTNNALVSPKYASPCQVLRYDATQTGMSDLISDMVSGSLFDASGRLADANIICMSMIPNKLIPTDYVTSKNISEVYMNTITKLGAPVTNLNGYTPQNKKCFIYPYNYITVNNGYTEKIYQYEKFNRQDTLIEGDFKIYGTIYPNGTCSIYPTNYDGFTGDNNLESLAITDFPMVAFPIDSYSAWLAQKSSTTIMQGIISTLTGAIAGATQGGVVGAVAGGAVGLTGGIANYITQSESARNQENAVKGTSSASTDILTGLAGYNITQKCVVADEARRIDNFFSMYGYHIGEVKTPNITGRTYWNYVKINGMCGYGNMPEEARNKINDIMNRGVTIWHNHANVGNYHIGGSAMQNPVLTPTP